MVDLESAEQQSPGFLVAAGGLYRRLGASAAPAGPDGTRCRHLALEGQTEMGKSRPGQQARAKKGQEEPASETTGLY